MRLNHLGAYTEGMAMGFSYRQYWVVWVVLLLVRTSAAVSGDTNTKEITVLVNNSAGVSPSVLSQAEIEAGRIFRAASIEIAWVNCPGGAADGEEACRVIPGANQFVLHIVPAGKTSTDSVFGVAFLGEDGTGKYCDVFFDRMRESRRESGVKLSQLLGTVAAHELGHLLLGSHAHTPAGIMTPIWANETLRQMNMGHLLFTRDQSLLMSSRIRREEFRVAGIRTGGGAAK
jgi:hypothetical protein